MGYRSDVTYAIEFRNLDYKRKFVALNKLHPSFTKALEECEEVETDNLFIIFEAKYIKWYDGYEDVLCHTEMLQAIEDEEMDGVAAKLVRVGEESGDEETTEYQGDNDYEPHAGEIPIEAEIISRIIDNLPRSKQPVTFS